MPGHAGHPPHRRDIPGQAGTSVPPPGHAGTVDFPECLVSNPTRTSHPELWFRWSSLTSPWSEIRSVESLVDRSVLAHLHRKGCLVGEKRGNFDSGGTHLACDVAFGTGAVRGATRRGLSWILCVQRHVFPIFFCGAMAEHWSPRPELA